MLLNFSIELAQYKTDISRQILIKLVSVIPDLLELYRSMGMWYHYKSVFEKLKTINFLLNL